MRRYLLCLCLLASSGCGEQVTVTPTASSVEIKGTLTAGGSPMNDVVLNLQPTADGLPAVIDVKNGEFSAQVTPGKYTWYLSKGKDEAAFKKVPEKYHAGSMDRQQEIGSGTSLALTVE